MAEEPWQVTKEPQGKAAQAQQVQQELQRVTTKNPKKAEAGKRLVAHNHKKREEWRKEQVELEKTGVNKYYSVGAVIALGVIGGGGGGGVHGLGYYIYRIKKGQVSREVKDVSMPYNPPQQPSSRSQSNKFEMD